MTPAKMPSRIHTFSGIMLDPLDLDPTAVRIIDIAEHLAKQCRYSGGTGSGDGWKPVEIEVAPGWVCTLPPGKHYSVGQHAVLASFEVAPEFAWDALHHDDAEFVLQDMAKPLKVDARLGQAYRGAEARIERVLAPLLDVRFPMPPEVKEADVRMLVTEADQLMHGRTEWANYRDIEPYDIKITPWSPARAARAWLARFFFLAEERGFVMTKEMSYGLEKVAP